MSDIEVTANILTTGVPSPWIDVEDYASFIAAIDAIDATERTLLISSEKAVADDKTVPSNVTLKFLQGGSLSISNTKTVTINGHVEAGLYQIFKGTGTVAFGSGSIKKTYPQWWGAKGDGVDDEIIAIQATIDATPNGGIITFPPGIYKISDALTIGNNKSIYGLGNHSDGVKIYPSDNSKNAIEASNGFAFIKNLFIDFGTKGTGHGIVFENAWQLKIENVRIYKAAYGFYHKTNAWMLHYDTCEVALSDKGWMFDTTGSPSYTTITLTNCYSNGCAQGGYFYSIWGLSLCSFAVDDCTLSAFEAVGVKNLSIHGLHSEGASIAGFGSLFIVNNSNGFVDSVLFADITVASDEGYVFKIDGTSKIFLDNVYQKTSAGTWRSLVAATASLILGHREMDDPTFSITAGGYFKDLIELSGSDTWNPASIANGAEEAKEVTVTGAALGDFAVASFSLDVTDLVLNAQVTLADKVTVVLSNNTGGAIDLASGTVYVKVTKK